MTSDSTKPSTTPQDGQAAADADAGTVLRFAAAYIEVTEAIEALLASDARDLDQIPGYAALEDQRRAALDRLCAARARDLIDLVAKARVLALRSDRAGVDADPLARGLAADLLAFADL